MTGDKSKFVSLNENKTRNDTFGNNETGRIKGKGAVFLSNGRGKAHDVNCGGRKKELILVNARK